MNHLPPWPGDYTHDGNPCCWFLSGIVKDLKGYRVPSCALPLTLRPFGMNGWVVADSGDALQLVPGNKWERTHEEGCRDYLALHAEHIAKDLATLKEWLEIDV